MSKPETSSPEKTGSDTSNGASKEKNGGSNGTSYPLKRHPSVVSDCVDVVSHSDLRCGQLVVSPALESRLARIEQEFELREKLQDYGLRHRQRILIYGPAKCGKTLAAERLAWNLNLPLRKLRLDILLEPTFKDTVANVREAVREAGRSSCVFMIQGSESLAEQESDSGELDRVVIAILEEISNYKGDGLLIISMNLEGQLDPQLMAGFDEVLKFSLPTVEEIARILQHTLSNMRTSEELRRANLAQRMHGMTGAAVVEIAHTASKNCILSGRSEMSLIDMQRALDEAMERHPRPAATEPWTKRY